MPNLGRVFLRLKYTDITQNTYIESRTVTEIMAREKFGLLAVPRTVPSQLALSVTISLYQNAQSAKDKPVLRYCCVFMCHVKSLEP